MPSLTRLVAQLEASLPKVEIDGRAYRLVEGDMLVREADVQRYAVARIEAQFTALRYFALDGTDHASHKEQASMIRRYIIWRNNHAYDERLRRIVDRANVA